MVEEKKILQLQNSVLEVIISEIISECEIDKPWLKWK